MNVMFLFVFMMTSSQWTTLNFNANWISCKQIMLYIAVKKRRWCVKGTSQMGQTKKKICRVDGFPDVFKQEGKKQEIKVRKQKKYL